MFQWPKISSILIIMGSILWLCDRVTAVGEAIKLMCLKTYLLAWSTPTCHLFNTFSNLLFSNKVQNLVNFGITWCVDLICTILHVTTFFLFFFLVVLYNSFNSPIHESLIHKNTVTINVTFRSIHHNFKHHSFTLIK